MEDEEKKYREKYKKKDLGYEGKEVKEKKMEYI